MREWRVVGTSFEHMHMGDLLREVHEHANAEIAGVCDQSEARMAEAIANFAISPERVFAEVAQCVREARPDLAILCPATARHADVVEEVAALGVDILIEKLFAASLADADRILAAVKTSGIRLAVNWPLRWYPPHVTMKRLIDGGSLETRSRFIFTTATAARFITAPTRLWFRTRRSGVRSQPRGGTARPPAAGACSTISAMARRSGPGS
jgi:predicted dehydrogenase